MSYQFPPSVRELVQRQMASGKYSTEDELLQDALEALSIEDEEFRAVEDALNAVEQGDPGVPLDEAFAELRRKYGIGPDA